MTKQPPATEAKRIEIGMSGDWLSSPLDPDLQDRVEAFEMATSDEKAKDVYAFYGLAMYYAQVVEAGLRNLLVAYARVFDDLHPNDVDTYELQFARDTLGRMLSRIRDIAEVNEQASSLLQDALMKRNWLAHRFFFDRIELFCGEAGQKKIVSELVQLTQLFRHADTLFEPLQHVLLEKLGANQEWLSKQFQELIASAESKYAG